MNPDYDLARPLASALKAKAPYVGIPIPGHAPLIFNRLLLVRAAQSTMAATVSILAGQQFPAVPFDRSPFDRSPFDRAPFDRRLN